MEIIPPYWRKEIKLFPSENSRTLIRIPRSLIKSHKDAFFSQRMQASLCVVLTLVISFYFFLQFGATRVFCGALYLKRYVLTFVGNADAGMDFENAVFFFVFFLLHRA